MVSPAAKTLGFLLCLFGTASCDEQREILQKQEMLALREGQKRGRMIVGVTHENLTWLWLFGLLSVQMAELTVGLYTQ